MHCSLTWGERRKHRSLAAIVYLPNLLETAGFDDGANHFWSHKREKDERATTANDPDVVVCVQHEGDPRPPASSCFARMVKAGINRVLRRKTNKPVMMAMANRTRQVPDKLRERLMAQMEQNAYFAAVLVYGAAAEVFVDGPYKPTVMAVDMSIENTWRLYERFVWIKHAFLTRQLSVQ